MSLLSEIASEANKIGIGNTPLYRQMDKGYGFLSNYMVPLEFITRYYMAGSLYDVLHSDSPLWGIELGIILSKTDILSENLNTSAFPSS